MVTPKKIPSKKPPSCFRWFSGSGTKHSARDIDDGWASTHCGIPVIRCLAVYVRAAEKDDCPGCVKAISNLRKNPGAKLRKDKYYRRLISIKKVTT